MHRRRLLLFLAVAVLCEQSARASWTRRYSTTHDVHDGFAAPLPRGGFAFAINGHPSGAILTIDAQGAVRTARTIGARDVIFLTTTPSGEIYAGLVGESEEEWNARIVGGTALIAKIDREGNPVWSKASRRMGEGLAVVGMANAHAVAFRSGESLEDGRAKSLLHLAAVRGDGSFAWQRSIETGEHAPSIPYGSDRGAMLASAEGGFVFTFGSAAAFIPLFRLDAKGGSDCAWLVDRVEEFDDGRIRAERRTIEAGAPGMLTVSADVSLLPLSVTEAAEPCAAGVRRMDMPPEPGTSPDDRVTRAMAPDAEDRHAQLFLAGRFRDLEEIAPDLRRPSRDPMRPHAPLRSFYDVMASEYAASEQMRLELLYRWIAEQPESFTARIALANALESAAWKRRGGGVAYFTTASGAAEYHDFMEKALDALDCAGIEAESDAMYWTLRIQFAAQLGLEDVRDVARRALAVHDDPGFVTSAAVYLEPQWGGSPAEVVAFVDEAARLLAPAYGDAAYAWVAFRRKPHRAVVGSEEYRFDWSRIRKGFEDMIRIAPEWLPTYHIYAYMAPIWQPRPVAAPAPSTPVDTSKWPRVIADSKSLLGEKGHPGLPAFRIETSGGRVAVMLDVAAQRAVAVQVTNTRSRIEPLKVSAAPVLARPVFVIACRRAQGRCTQVVLEAQLFSTTKGRDPDSPRRFQIAFAERPEAAVAGGAVVDESGAVFGVVIGEAAMWSPNWKFIADVADVADAIRQ